MHRTINPEHWPSGDDPAPVTVRAVQLEATRRPIDRRRTLTPRDYLREPALFGITSGAEFHRPDNGDDISLQLAITLHRCVVAWRAHPHRSTGAELARGFGFSKQTWSDVTAGRRWPGHTVVLALIAQLE